MTLIQYKSIPYGHSPKPTVEDMERHILTTTNKVVTTEAARAVLEWHRRRERELEDELHRMKEKRIVGQDRVFKQGVTK